MSQLQPPSSVSPQGNRAEKWKIWIQKFEPFCTDSGVAEKVQRATFLHFASEEAIKICNTLVFRDDDIYKIEVLKRKFLDYCGQPGGILSN